jgi:glycosyl transferase family 25
MSEFTAGPPIHAAVINLARHPERLECFMAAADRAGLTVERIDAIDANDDTVRAQIEGIRHEGSKLSNAEAACILSHRKAWQWLLDSQDSFLAVFEDDVYLSEDMRQLLSPDLLTADLDLVKLEIPTGKVSYCRKAYAGFLGRRLHRLLTKANGSGGYIVSRKCAQRLLEVSGDCSEPVDFILFDDKSPIWRDFSVLQVVPAACIQDTILSKFNGVSERFSSAIAMDSRDEQAQRKIQNKKNKKQVSFKKLRRYLHCIRNGANPFKYKQLVPWDLGFPGTHEQ